jgi:catechol 2,3-dioxygenase-like lactoylglutathione lyase family enzyme/uncharacterized membrane protein
MRTFSAPAFLSVAWAGRRRPRSFGWAERALRSRAAPWLFGALAAFELAADQWPGLQARIAPPSLLGRVLSGALVGTALGRGRSGVIAIAAGSAALSTFVSYELRRAANRRLPNSVSGLFEDVFVLGAGAALALRARNHDTRRSPSLKTDRVQFPAPREGFVLTHFITSRDVARSAAFYRDVLGGQVVLEGEPTAVKLANGWIIVNVGGGPTDDKPDVVLETPRDPHRTSSFLNLRVADIQAVYEEWRRKGAEFLTPPKQHADEIRCYMRDPDGYLIEVGQSTGSSTGQP